MRKKVVVIGGGVAGLTAAHELIERGFDVTLYERRGRLGGKAASVENKRGFPGEHGFRFFPGWYQHLPDSMKRIPYEERTEKRTVYQNLVSAERSLFASYHRDSIEALVRFPRSWEDLRAAASSYRQFRQLGLTHDDLRFFFARLLEFAMTPDDERIRRFDGQTWWNFMQADDLSRTRSFRDYLVIGLTRNTVAAKPKESSAYTIGHAVLRTLFDTLRPEGMDRVLNGPTSEVWIDPWVEYLKAQGVDIVTGAELTSIEFDPRLPRITKVHLRRGDLERRGTGARLGALRFLRRLQASTTAGLEGWLLDFLMSSSNGLPRPASAVGLKSLVSEWAVKFEKGCGGELERDFGDKLKQFEQKSVDRTSDKDKRSELGAWLEAEYKGAWAEHESALDAVTAEEAKADYFVFALPVEQMAYYVHRSEMLRRHDPSLANIIVLSEHVDWMAGIQFYLKENEKIVPGHVDCLDSEWHLTAISQTQFWPDIDMKERGKPPYRGAVKAIVSVDISAWNVKGNLHRKEAFSCDRQEIAEEVWSQLQRSLNRPNRKPILRDEMLLGHGAGSDRVPSDSYHLDDNIVDRYDRKKQAFYERLESVHFSSEAVAARQSGPNGQSLQTSLAYGDRLELNGEPLLVSRPGSLALRPGVRTNVSNMFLAADYVRTNTNLATMEAANEAGRAAVNQILLDSGSREEPCRVWQWQPSDVVRSLKEILIGREGSMSPASAVTPLHLAADAASAATGLAARALGRISEWRKRT
jgi:uncharacterized protein with NAD-binding domain and iron-sulfur cluster